MDKPTLYMLVGVPGSGKSYWATNMKDILNFTIFSSDEYREKLTGNVNDTEHNNLVFQHLHKDLINCLQEGHSVCYDATNVKRRDRTRFLKQIKDIDCTKVAIVIDTDEDMIKYQNDNRDRVVPWEVIEKMRDKFVMPSEEEGFDSVTTIHKQQEKKNFQESDISTEPYIPENCKHCPNHPSNGGSGICLCTLGGPQITY